VPIVTGRNPDMEAAGLVMPVRVAPSLPIRNMLIKRKEKVPKSIELIALVDTGATRTVVREGTCTKLNLTPRNQVLISTAGEPCYANEYDVELHFHMLNISFETIFFLEAPLTGQNITCLIGRDLLSKGILFYNGFDNSYTLGF
jgi:predicted aspartyl protease